MKCGVLMVAGAALASSSLLACSGGGGGGGGSGAKPESSCVASIDRWKEIEIVDDKVIGDPRSVNATDGAWSFRHAVEKLAPEGQDPSEFVHAWLDLYGRDQTINLYATAARPGAREKIVCPWLLRSPENGCDPACTTCAAEHLDLAKAPFRLLAIANRLDLAGTGVPAEGRFVFGAVDGEGDDPNAKPMDMTVIFEFHLPLSDAHTLSWWASQWHALGNFTSYDEPYRAALQQITDTYATANSLGQVRSNERIFDWDWNLREFHLGDDRRLHNAGVFNTPDQSWNASPQLATWINANKSSVLAQDHIVPPNFLGGAANPNFTWVVPGLDEATRHAFAKQTCAGCHQTEAQSVDFNFHISPYRSGTLKVSPFLNNPSDSQHDELAHRAAYMETLLCAP